MTKDQVDLDSFGFAVFWQLISIDDRLGDRSLIALCATRNTAEIIRDETHKFIDRLGGGKSRIEIEPLL